MSLWAFVARELVVQAHFPRQGGLSLAVECIPHFQLGGAYGGLGCLFNVDGRVRSLAFLL
jgi:hypothetical protein